MENGLFLLRGVVNAAGARLPTGIADQARGAASYPSEVKKGTAREEKSGFKKN